MSLNVQNAPAAGAPRLKKPSWKDPRLLVGILLVLASVAGVVALVDTADQTVDVYAVKDDTPVGTELSPEDLAVVAVRLGPVTGHYVRVEDGLPQNAIAVSMLRSGELLPESSLGAADDLDRQPVGFTVQQPLQDSAGPGSLVDVWISMPGEQREFEEPQLVLEGVEIAAREDSESALGGNSFTSLHVLVTEDKMATLLSAISNEARIAVIPNPGGAS